MNRFKQFMQGRYGVDQLSNGLMFLFLILILLGIITQISIFTFLAIIPVVYSYFRMFSKNFSKRYNENRIYTNFMSPYYNFTDKLKRKMQKKMNRMKSKKTHRYFKCPNCKQELRVPKGHGVVTITCPKCHTEFDKKS